ERVEDRLALVALPEPEVDLPELELLPGVALVHLPESEEDRLRLAHPRVARRPRGRFAAEADQDHGELEGARVDVAVRARFLLEARDLGVAADPVAQPAADGFLRLLLRHGVQLGDERRVAAPRLELLDPARLDRARPLAESDLAGDVGVEVLRDVRHEDL